jgi:hypothetical protein
MQRELAILQLDPSGSETARVRRQKLEGDSRAVPGVDGFFYVNLQDPGMAVPDEARAAAIAHGDSLEGLAGALMWPEGTVARAAITETFTTAGGSRQTNAYVQTNLAEHEYWLQVRGSHTVKRAPSLRQPRFVTGPCLFSSRMLTAKAEDGSAVNLLHPSRHLTKRLATLDARPELSFYELESCVRQARLISDLARGWPGLEDYTVTIDVPREQYYAYLLEGLAAGLVDRELMLRWVALVDARFDQVVGCMTGELLSWSRRAGLPEPKIHLAAGFAGLRESLLSAVSEQKAPALDELTAELAQRSRIWGQVHQLEPPQNLGELINLSYAVEYVQAQSGGQAGSTMLVAVEDRSELRILLAAQRLSRLLDPGAHTPMLGLYSLEQVMLAGLDNWSLYLNDPGTQFALGGGHTLSSRELLGQLYGADA